MANTSALVTKLEGQAWIRNADGNLEPLRVGMRIPVDAEIITAAGTQLALQGNEEGVLQVAEDQQLKLADELFVTPDPAAAAIAALANADVNALITALNQGQDPLAELDPTAATLAGGEGGGSTFVRLSNVIENTSPLALQYPTSSVSTTEDFNPGGGVVAVEAAAPQPVVGVVTLTADNFVIEGGKINVVATVSTVVTGSDLIITLNNGAQITIPVGSTTGATQIETRTDDFYSQGDNSVGISIATTTGGEFDQLDTSSTASTTVQDDSDATTVTLEAPATVTEGGVITVTATVSNAVTGSPLVITLVGGAQITIPVGQSTGTVDINTRTDDVYVQGDAPLQFKVESATGGNYEALDVRSTASTMLQDDSDQVFAVIAVDKSSVAEGGSLVYTVKLVNKEGADVSVPAGKSVNVALSWSGDAANDSDTTGRPDQVFAVIAVDKSSVAEGGSLVYTVKLVNKEGADVSVPAGKSVNVALSWSGDAANDSDTTGRPTSVTISGSNQTTFTVGTVDDVAKEAPEQLVAQISGVTDTDNTFESLVKGAQDTATSTITDEPVGQGDIVYAKIRVVGNDTTVEGGVLTYEVSLVNEAGQAVTVPDGKSVTVNLDWGMDLFVAGKASIGDVSSWGVVGTGVSGSNSLPSSVTISGGSSATIAVQTQDDTQVELLETLTATITGVVDTNNVFENLKVTTVEADKFATGKITDNDVAGQLIVDDNPGHTLYGGGGNDVVIGDKGGDTIVPGTVANIVFVLDASGSMSGDRWTTMKAAVIKAMEDLAASGAKDVMVHLVSFGTNSTDLGSFRLTSNYSDNQTALTAAKKAVTDMQLGDFTNYEAGLNLAYNWINSTSGTGTSAPPLSGADINKLIFVTDGEPNRALNNSQPQQVVTVTASEAMQHVLGTYDPSGTTDDDTRSEVGLILGKGYQIEAVGINVGSSVLTFLGQIEGSTGNGATNVTDTTQLSGVIGQLLGTSDLVNAVGDDTIQGGAGGDVILGDSIYASAVDKGWAAYLAANPGATDAEMLANIYANLTTGDRSYAQEGTVGGNDALYGGAGNDHIFGQGGNDKLYGESGDDKLYGGTGSDLLVAGTGNDVLTGGAGSDTFKWSLADLDGGVDRILDFQAATHVPAVNWKYTVDFANNPKNFDDNNSESIQIKIGGVTYTGKATSGAGGAGARFDSAAANLVSQLLTAGFIASYDPANNTFTIESASNLSISATSTASNTGTGTVEAIQVGSPASYAPIDVLDLTDIPVNRISFAEEGGHAAVIVKGDGGETIQTIVLENYTLNELASAFGTSGGNLVDVLVANDVLLVGPAVVDSGGQARMSMLAFQDDAVAVSEDQSSTNTLAHEVRSTAGNDTLIGTDENDLFVWSDGDAGTGAQPAVDTVKKFGMSDADPNGKDVLDLGSLLQGEEASDADLTKFLNITKDGTDTVVKISSTGVLGADGAGFDQKIILEDVDLTSGNSADQSQLIKQLIQQGKITMDGNHN